MDLFSSVGYLTTGMLYLFLLLLLVSVWRGRKLGGYLFVACLASATWGFLIAGGGAYASVRPSVLFGVELARAATWVTFILVLVKRLGVGRLLALFPHAVWVAALILGCLAIARETVPGTSWTLHQVMLFGGLAMSLAALVLIEQLYRNSPPDTRWSLKPLVLGLGGLFAFDLFVFSQGVLFGGIESVTWVARGWANALFVPLIAVAIRRNHDWELRIFVSRQVVFYTTTLFAVGLYLLAVSFGGYLLIRFGGEWGAVARIVFFVGAGIVLLSLLFSGSMRAWLRVTLSKHFYQNKYDYRKEWQRLVAVLSESGSSAASEAVVRAVAELVDSPAAHLWVMDPDDRKLKAAATYGIEESVPDIEVDDPVIDYVLRDGWLIDSAEYFLDPSMYSDLEIRGWLRTNAQSWLLVPLMSHEKLLGLILLYRSSGMPLLNYEDRDLLKLVGNHVAVHVAQEQADQKLAEARQFETYNKLSAFLMHDISNLVAQLSLIVENAEKHRRNPQFVDDTIDTIANSVQRMRALLAQLKRDPSSAQSRRADVMNVVEQAIHNCSDRRPAPELTSNQLQARISVNPRQFEMVLSHLIKNAQEACTADGKVSVNIERVADTLRIEVVDNGKGMSQEFIRHHLFRPFDSTKGSQGMGIGAYQSREFARQYGGDLNVHSEVDRGTTITLILPIDQ